MEFIKKNDLRSEYFDKKLWVIAGLSDAEKDELQLLSPFRTNTDQLFKCSDRAYQILKQAFGKLEKAIAMDGHIVDMVMLVGHDMQLFARNKKGDIVGRVPMDDKIPRD